jgi:hypothetical protein
MERNSEKGDEQYSTTPAQDHLRSARCPAIHTAKMMKKRGRKS